MLGRQPDLRAAFDVGVVRDRIVAMMDDIRMGDVRDFRRNFMGAVIDERGPDRISGHIDEAAAPQRLSPAVNAISARDTSSGPR